MLLPLMRKHHQVARTISPKPESPQENHFPSKKNSTRSSPGHVGFFSDRTAEKNCQKNKLFDKIPTTLARRSVFRSKVYIFPLNFLNNQSETLTTLPRRLAKCPKIFRSTYGKIYLKNKFFKKTLS